MERKFVIQARGYDFGWLMDSVTGLFGLRPKEIEAGGKQRRAVKAISAVPIPALAILLGSGLLGLAAIRKRFKNEA